MGDNLGRYTSLRRVVDFSLREILFTREILFAMGDNLARYPSLRRLLGEILFAM